MEISFTNGLTPGIDPPLGDAGDIEGSPGAALRRTAGKVVLSKGVIAAGVEDFQIVELIR